ncbi:MAG: Rhizobium phage vB RleM [Pseudomonadota bacterium]|jgi:hypothetical protein
MSSIALSPNASGTATFTIAAPGTNTNRTLTLPDEAGTVLTNASNIEAQAKTALNATGSAPVYGARAWVTFNGSNGSIVASGNVSGVTRNGVGDYTITFSTAMPDANYAVSAIASRGASTTRGLGAEMHPTVANTASACRIRTFKVDTDPAVVDAATVHVVIYG